MTQWTFPIGSDTLALLKKYFNTLTRIVKYLFFVRSDAGDLWPDFLSPFYSLFRCWLAAHATVCCTHIILTHTWWFDMRNNMSIDVHIRAYNYCVFFRSIDRIPFRQLRPLVVQLLMFTINHILSTLRLRLWSLFVFETKAFYIGSFCTRPEC